MAFPFLKKKKEVKQQSIEMGAPGEKKKMIMQFMT